MNFGKVSRLDGKTVFALTLYLECRGEPTEGQQWVGWVIKNRAAQGYADGTIKGVCLQPWQFECWNGRDTIQIENGSVYQRIRNWSDQLYDQSIQFDPTGGCDHYNNPKKEKADWVERVTLKRIIGDHHFYKA